MAVKLKTLNEVNGKAHQSVGLPKVQFACGRAGGLDVDPARLPEHAGRGGGVRSALSLFTEKRTQDCYPDAMPERDPYLEITMFCCEGTTLRCDSGVGRPFLHSCHSAQAAPRLCVPSLGREETQRPGA